MRGVFRGLAGLLLLLAVLGGGAGYWLFLRGGEMLRVELLNYWRKKANLHRSVCPPVRCDWYDKNVMPQWVRWVIWTTVT